MMSFDDSMKALVHDALMRIEIISQLAVGQNAKVQSHSLWDDLFSFAVRRSLKLPVAAREAQYGGRYPSPIQE